MGITSEGMNTPRAFRHWAWRLAMVATQVATPCVTLAQGSRADYERSANLRRTTANKIFRDQVEPHWLTGNTQFWYEVRTGADTREYVHVDAEKGVRQLAFDHEKIASALRGAGVSEARADRLVLRDLEWPSTDTLAFTAARKRWRVALSNYAVLEQSEPPPAPATGLAPEDAPTASLNTGEETSVRFHNRSAGPVELFWLNAEGASISYGGIPAGETKEVHTFAGHVWVVRNAAGQRIVAFEGKPQPLDAVITGDVVARQRPAAGRGGAGETRRPAARSRSPDGKWSAAIKDHNVVLTEVASGEQFVLSTDGRADHSYRDRFFWSPDSKKLAAVRVEPGEERKISFVESSPKGKVQPALHTFNYYKPGDKLPHPRPALFDIAARKQLPIDDALFPNPYTTSDNLELRWERDSSRFSFRYNQRGHQVLRVIGVDAATGTASAIVDEQSKTFISYSGKSYLEWLEDTGELIWMSERDGWNHLYLYDAKTGRVKNQVTRGEWMVRTVDRVDKEKRQIWFQAGGIVPGQDPYHVHYARVNFDGAGLVTLTEGDGTHALTFSPDRRFALDRHSRVDLPSITSLRRTDTGKLVCELERADAGALTKSGWRAPERFVAKARDGVTDIYGVILRPSNFDPAIKYPVIENIYAGPHAAFVPKSFVTHAGLLELAELGFIIVKIDGLGTSERSKAFHDVAWQNVGDAGLPDRVLWIKAAAKKFPEMDITKVGIYGTSAGGQSAAGAMFVHGDFYKVAVSDCGCHDNRMDKIWWNEQWMGWPIGPHYAAQSNVTLAPKLTGKLLLMVGEMDRNVDPASTMQVANALIKANKDFDLVVVPGAGHGVAGSPFGKRKLQDFFVRHLLGREPRWE